MGLHGMVAFGKPGGAMFMSHIPMFHPPHDIQAVFQVKLPPNRHDLSTGTFTFKPDPFPLDDMLTGNLKTMKGTLYRGNFEAGGTPLEKITVEVERVVKAGPLVGSAPANPKLEYMLVGTKDNAYLVHKVTRPPDFDQILKVKVDGSGFTDAQLAAGVSVTIPSKKNIVADRLKLGPVSVVVSGSTKPMKLTVERELSSLVGPDFTQPPI